MCLKYFMKTSLLLRSILIVRLVPKLVLLHLGLLLLLSCCHPHIFTNAATSYDNQTPASSTSYGRYPQNALECHASASPKGRTICPKDRNDFCVKEVVSSPRNLCGESIDHPFDKWDIKEPGGLCVYKKCASQKYCVSSNNRTVTFRNKGTNHTRLILCCSGNLCNAAYLLPLILPISVTVTLTTVLALVMWDRYIYT
jgi:hypothetical protein